MYGLKKVFVLPILIALVSLVFSACEVGLGDEVDTESPTLSITSVELNSVISGDFSLAGSCDDDTGVTSVKIILSYASLSNSVTYTKDAIYASIKGNTWSYDFKKGDLEDGEWTATITAYDGSGRSSGEVSRKFEIDNTAPVFILKSPASVDSSNPTAYGKTFKITGEIADDHTISQMEVAVYNADKSVEYGSYTSTNVSTAGGTSVVIAKYSDSSTGTIYDNYNSIYGSADDAQTSPYYCEITLTDEAGNQSTSCYLYDDYSEDSLLSSVTVTELMEIINGTYDCSTESLSESEVAEVKTKLASIEQTGTYFTLDKNASPTYAIAGYSAANMSALANLSAVSGQKVTVTVSPGADGNYIKPATLKAYWYKVTGSESSEEIENIVADPESFAATDDHEVSTDFPVYNFANNSSYSSGSVESYTWSLTLPTELAEGSTYLILISGEDTGSLDLEPNSGYYGFKLSASGNPPTVKIESPASLSYINTTAGLTFTGTAVPASGEDDVTVNYTLTITSEDSSTVPSAYSTITGSTTASYSDDYAWTLDITKGSGYHEFTADNSDVNYLYTIAISATDSSNNTSAEASRSIHLDTTAPEVSLSSLTPYVTVTDSDGNSSICLNGKINFNGTISDLSGITSVSYTLKDASGNSSSESLTSGYTFSASSIDTTAFNDGDTLTLTVSATDKAGNTGSYTGSYKLDQSTDAPSVTLSNANKEITDAAGIKAAYADSNVSVTNIFGTKSNNQLLGTVTDDDGISSVVIYYKKHSEADSEYKALFTKENINSTSYSLSNVSFASASASLSEALYDLKFVVTDTANETSYATLKDSVFAVAIDDGAPEFSNVTPSSGNTYSSSFDVSATITDGSGGLTVTSSGDGTSTLSVTESEDDSTTFNLTDKITVPEADGNYSVVYTATDAYGQASTYSISYYVDTTAPIIKLSTIDGSADIVTNNTAVYKKGGDDAESISFTGTMSDTVSGIESIKYYIDTDTSNATQVSMNTSKGTWSASVDLSEITTAGEHTVSFVATDVAGNSTTTSKAITVDMDTPSSTITMTPDTGVKLYDSDVNALTDTTVESGEKYYSTGKVTFSGEVTETYLSKISYTLNNEETELTLSDNTWEIVNDGSTDGSYVYTLTVTDKAGRSTSYTFTLVVDTTAPVVSIISPSADEIVSSTTKTIQGTFTEEGSGIKSLKYTLTKSGTKLYDGEEVTLSSTVGSDISWKVENLSLGDSEGAFEIYVVATDYLGHETTSDTVSFVYDTAAPNLTESHSASVTTNEAITLTGKAWDTNELASISVSYTDADGNNQTLSSSDEDSLISLTAATSEPSDYNWSLDLSKLNLSDRSYDFTITATDVAFKTKELTRSVTIDTVAPVFGTTAYDSTDSSSVSSSSLIPTITTTAYTYTDEATENDETVTRVWYKNSSVTIRAGVTDATSGISSVEYQVSTKASYDESGSWSTMSSSSSSSSTAWNGSATAVLSSDYAKNYIYFRATDTAGNITYWTSSLVAYFDSQAPDSDNIELVSVDDETSLSSSFVKYVNSSTESVTVKLTASDTEQTLSADSDSKVSSGIGSVVLKTDSSVKATKEDSTWTLVIPKANFSTGTVAVTVSDNVGNATNVNLFSLEYDTTAPTGSFSTITDADSSTDGIQVNKDLTLTGTAKDTNLSKIKLEYTTGDVSDSSSWTVIKLLDDSSEEVEEYSITDGSTSYSWTSSVFDTTKVSDGSSVTFRLTMTDKAGNEGTASKTVITKQDSDRPTIKVTSLSSYNDSYVLKNGENAQISGSISDDDSSDNSVVTTFIATTSQLTAIDSSSVTSETSGTTITTKVAVASASYDITTFDSSTGEWTFTPYDTNDGAHTVYFYVVDNNGAVFYTGKEAESVTAEDSTSYTVKYVPYLYLSADTSTVDNTDALNYNADSNSPTVDSAVYVTTVDNEEVSTSISTGLVLGGDTNTVDFKITASDANGIAGIIATLTSSTSTDSVLYYTTASTIADTDYSSYTVDSDEFDTTTSSTSASWYIRDIPLSSFTTGSITVKVTSYDNSGLSGSNSFTFMLDNTGPTINLTSPSSSEEVTGSISLVGSSTDTGGSTVESIEYMIPTTEQQALSDTELLALSSGTGFWGGNTKTTSVLQWEFVLDSSSNPSLENYDSDSYYSSYSDGIYTIPVYFRAKDALGNASILKSSLKHNPDADKPVTTFTYPTEDDYDSGKSYITLSGTIRLSGAIEIPSGTTTVDSVYLQIDYDNDGSFDSDDSTYLESCADGYTIVDAESLLTNVQSNNSDVTEITGWTSETTSSNWWGIKASKSSSSWNISINTNNGLDPDDDDSDDIREIRVRACAVNALGKIGAWSSSYTIYIDKNAPTYSSILAQYDNGSSYTDGTSFTNATASATNSYTSGMYLKGDWYIVSTFTDESGIDTSTISVKKNSSKLTVNTDYYVDSSSTANTAIIYIPVDKSSSSVTYTVEAYDNSTSGTAHSSTATYSLYIDNEAPTLSSIKGNDEAFASASTRTDIEDSNFSYKISGTSTDTGSGVEKIVFYFMRGEDDVLTSGNECILDPMLSSSKEIIKDNLDSFEITQDSSSYYMYGKSGIEGSQEDTTSFTPSNSEDITGNSHIRNGGLIYIGGLYRVITAIDSSTGKVTFASATDGTATTAAFPYAQVIDATTEAATASYNNGFSWNFSTTDDGDGMPETFKSSGSSWSWTASIHSGNMADGPVSLVILAFDEAGNVSQYVQSAEIVNNVPRLAKVYLGTDLNGDDSWSLSEFQGYAMSVDSSNEYSSTNTLKTAASSYGYDSAFAIKDKLAVIGEFTGGNNGLKMVFKQDASSTTTSPVEGSGDALLDSDVSLSSISSTSATVAFSDSNSVTFTDAAYNSNYVTNYGMSYSMYGFILDSTTVAGVSSEDELSSTTDGSGKQMSFTFWDATEEKTQGKDSQNCVLYVSDFIIDVVDEVNPTSSINPFYWTSSSDNSIYYNDSTAMGHIDLGTIPSVSGVVKLTGSIYDDQRLASVTISYAGENIATSSYTAKSASWSSDGDLSSNGYNLTVEDDGEISQSGHTANWTLLLDTAYFGNASSKVIAVKATQAKTVSDSALESDASSTQTSSDTKTNYYKISVVPYITDITREDTISGGTMNRSYIGRYAVAEGETLTVEGFNFGTAGTWTVGSNNTETSYTATNSSATARASFTMTVPARSGALTVTCGTSSLNNSNSDSEAYNSEEFKMGGSSTKYTAADNRYLSVWNLGNYFNNTSDGAELQQPVMTADKDGNLYASWAAQSNSNIMINKGLGGISSAVFRCYDQPSVYTGIAFDQKGTSGGANITFIPEHQGSGGTFGRNGMSSTHIVGGSGSINLPSDFMTNSTSYSGYTATVDGNPTFNLDSSGNKTSYYSLESYDVNRRLGSFENPQSARYGNYLHNIWYDNVSESLKYSVVDISDESKFNYNSGAINGWVVLDGGYTGQDRLHTFTQSNTVSGVTAGKTYKEVVNVYNNVLASFDYIHSAVSKDDIGDASKARTYRNSAVYSTEIFVINTNITSANSYSTTSLSYSGLSFYDGALNPEVGDTVAILLNTNGSYKIELRTITAVSGTDDNGSAATIGWDKAVSFLTSDNIGSITATIYKGDMNVVGGEATADLTSFSAADDQSSSAGSSAAIDVTTEGYPVVAYYDGNNSELRVAVASSSEPSLASQWTRISTGKTCSGEVSMKIDGANNIHIMYNNEDGEMCYLFGKYSSGSYNFASEEVVDDNGSLSYGSISVYYDGESYVPTMTYLNKANTANAVKYAYRTAAPASSSSASWDFMIIPSVGSGHYALKENTISLESSNNWTSETTSVLQNVQSVDGASPSTATPATVESVVAFKTSNAYETAYLKKE
ncbi:MAG: hypothetical protein K6F69_05490 [Treponema sp.]|nr:hypothetical protein [Treponema sp.]